MVILKPLLILILILILKLILGLILGLGLILRLRQGTETKTEHLFSPPSPLTEFML